jgi:hypothetical protein
VNCRHSFSRVRVSLCSKLHAHATDHIPAHFCSRANFRYRFWRVVCVKKLAETELPPISGLWLRAGCWEHCPSSALYFLDFSWGLLAFWTYNFVFFCCE